MAPSPTSAVLIRFGEFEVNLLSRELRQDGAAVRLPDQSFEVLVMLLERPGQLVLRDEIRKRLWSADTFVDFDHGLNNAVKRLRDALGDSAEAPRFVATLPRRGYRFIGNLEAIPDRIENAAAGDVPSQTQPVRARASSPRNRFVWIAIAAGMIILAGIAFWSFGAVRHPAIHKLAVLPLQNFSGDSTQDYFADGMTDELITMLAKNRDLLVISRTSAMRYKEDHRPLREIARELGVDGILEGSVARRGNRVHVTAQLIHAGSDTHLWAESYDRDLNDVSSLQSELANTIARQVGSSITPSSQPEKRIIPEAHDAYMMGRFYWFSEDFNKSHEYFERAISLQPDYAAAWSGLADNYLGRAATGAARPQEVLHEGDAAARKSVELDDSLAEAHNSLAADYLIYHWNAERAERESARTLELNPGFAEAHHLRGYILQALNRHDEAVQEQRKAMELDPFARPWELAYALMRARQYDAALNEARSRSQAQPGNADLHETLGTAYGLKGMEKEAAQEWEISRQLGGNTDGARALRHAFEHGGLRAVFELHLDELRKQAVRKYVSPLEVADVHACLKHKEEALHYLEQAYQEHTPWLVRIQSDPDFDFLHSDPRYKAIVQKMGLSPSPDTRRVVPSFYDGY